MWRALSDAPNIGAALMRPVDVVVIDGVLGEMAGEARTLAGLRRLRELIQQLRDEIKYLANNLPDIQQMCLHYATVGPCDELKRDFVDHYHKAYFKIRREFGRLGVIVMRADQEEPVQVVLDRLDRLRGVGRRR